jgi:hypothetical protein
MDEVIPRNPTTIRKSAFGRTNLFLPSSDVLLREVQCMGGVTRHENVSVFHMHDISNKKNVACWHCCEQFKGDGIPAPRLYDPVEQIYHVYGIFCSANCTKAYILENSTFDRGQHLNVFVKMLREVYGIKERVVEAPPRIALERFGGPFKIDTFRTMKNICSTCKPPFVSYCMVVEERMMSIATDKHELFELQRPDEIMEDISEPPNEAMYQSFLDSKTNKETNVEEPPVPVVQPSQSTTNTGKKRKDIEKNSSSSSINTLARYAKK